MSHQTFEKKLQHELEIKREMSKIFQIFRVKGNVMSKNSNQILCKTERENKKG